jgi:hypothetical protein
MTISLVNAEREQGIHRPLHHSKVNVCSISHASSECTMYALKEAKTFAGYPPISLGS